VADVNLKAKITLQDDASKPIASFKQQLVGLAQTSGLAGSAIGTLVGGGLAGLAGLALETAAGDDAGGVGAGGDGRPVATDAGEF
jgi:hypothetical protein